MDCTLTILDTAGIQSYIFNTNELRENIGASHLVFLATTHWVQDGLDKVLGASQHNYRVKKDETDPYDASFQLETSGTDARAEVMYAGGGNTFILFAGDNHEAKAKAFVFALSARIIEQAPGLNLYAAHEAFDWDNGDLPEAIAKAMKSLAFYKNSKPVYQPMLGLGVTAACTSTQLPANGNHPDGDKNGANNTDNRPTLANRANRQVMAQWHAAKGATERLRALFPFVEAEDNFHWTDDLDKIGNLPGKDESFIAVVHADGNGMGKKMLTLTQIFKDHFPDEPRLYIASVRQLSKQFRETAQTALTATIQDLFSALKAHEANDDILFHIGKETHDNGRRYFPFRPVIFGGDDVTFVCAGGWGVRLAHRYLHYLEGGAKISGFQAIFADYLVHNPNSQLEQKQRDGAFWEDKSPFACAGISIVKTHYPISRAYENSEALAKSAKQMVRSYRPDKMASALDWHFTTTGLAGTLSEIRAREYKAMERMEGINHPYVLTMRPIMLGDAYTWRNWNNFLNVFAKFYTGWADKRNKMMALRETLREGPRAVAEFEQLESSSDAFPPLGDIVEGETVRLSLQHGWMDWPDVHRETAVANHKSLSQAHNYDEAERELNEIRCAFFDAIELQNQFYELKKEEVPA